MSTAAPATAVALVQGDEGSVYVALGAKATRRQIGDVLMDLHGLAPAKADQVYMAWLSSDGGSTTKAGILTVDDQGKGFLELDNPRPVSSLWLMVCLEPNAAVTKPGPVIASGTIWLFSGPSISPAV